jgi:hypothetical protein
MGWMIEAIVVLFVTNATAIWKWHLARNLNKTLSASVTAYKWSLDLADRCDGELRRKVYWARGGQWRKNQDFGQDTTLMAIELIEDLHNRVADLAWNTQPEPAREDPCYANPKVVSIQNISHCFARATVGRLGAFVTVPVESRTRAASSGYVPRSRRAALLLGV